MQIGDISPLGLRCHLMTFSAVGLVEARVHPYSKRIYLIVTVGHEHRKVTPIQRAKTAQGNVYLGWTLSIPPSSQTLKFTQHL